MGLQWNPFCEVTPFTSEKWPFKRGGLSSGVEINIFMFRFTLSTGLSRGGGLSSGWPLKRGSTVVLLMLAPKARFPKILLPLDINWPTDDFFYISQDLSSFPISAFCKNLFAESEMIVCFL